MEDLLRAKSEAAIVTVEQSLGLKRASIGECAMDSGIRSKVLDDSKSLSKAAVRIMDEVKKDIEPFMLSDVDEESGHHLSPSTKAATRGLKKMVAAFMMLHLCLLMSRSLYKLKAVQEGQGFDASWMDVYGEHEASNHKFTVLFAIDNALWECNDDGSHRQCVAKAKVILIPVKEKGSSVLAFASRFVNRVPLMGASTREIIEEAAENDGKGKQRTRLN